MSDFSTVKFQTILFAGDQISHYFNLSILEQNANFSSWAVHLVHPVSFVVAYPNILTLTKDIISGSDYRFYFQDFEVPSLWQDGCYRIVIVDTADSDEVLYITDELRVISDSTDTILTRYRNDVNIQNTNYETLTTFYNTVRVPLIKRKPLPLTIREGYDTVDGVFKPVRTTFGKTYEFVTDWMDDDGHDALNVATLHSEFQIFEDNNWVNYDRPDGEDYSQNFEEEYPLADAAVRLRERDASSTNRAK